MRSKNYHREQQFRQCGINKCLGQSRNSPSQLLGQRGIRVVINFMHRSIKERFQKQHYLTHGRALYLIGNVQELGDWDPHRAIRMDWNNGNLWSTKLRLPKAQVEYKFIEGGHDNIYDGGIIWELGDNRVVKEDRKDADVGFRLTSVYAEKGDIDKGYLLGEIERVDPSILVIQHFTKEDKNFLIKEFGDLYNLVGVSPYIQHKYKTAILYEAEKFALVDSGFVFMTSSHRPESETDNYLVYATLKDHRTNDVILALTASIYCDKQEETCRLITDTLSKLLEEDEKFREKKVTHKVVVAYIQNPKSEFLRSMHASEYIHINHNHKHYPENVFYHGGMVCKGYDICLKSSEYMSVTVLFQ